MKEKKKHILKISIYRLFSIVNLDIGEDTLDIAYQSSKEKI